MVVLARIEFVEGKCAAGYPVSVHFSGCMLNGREKVRFVIGNVASESSPLQPPSCLLAALGIVRQYSAHSVVVDRGHRYSSGASEVCFYFQHRCNGSSGWDRLVLDAGHHASSDIESTTSVEAGNGDFEMHDDLDEISDPEHVVDPHTVENVVHPSPHFVSLDLGVQAHDEREDRHVVDFHLTGKGRGSSSAQGYTKVTNPSCLRPMGADVPVAEVSDQVADGRASGQYAAVDVNPPCACGYPSMRLTVSMAGPNLGKSFYRCNECCFFQWEGSDVVEYYSNG